MAELCDDDEIHSEGDVPPSQILINELKLEIALFLPIALPPDLEHQHQPIVRTTTSGLVLMPYPH